MQNISIKAGTNATISITPKIGGSVATLAQLNGVKIYVFFVYQYTNKIYGTPHVLTADSSYSSTNTLKIHLTPEDTLEMLGNAAENQRFEIQFAIKDADGQIIAENKSSVAINIVRWEAGEWLHQHSI